MRPIARKYGICMYRSPESVLCIVCTVEAHVITISHSCGWPPIDSPAATWYDCVARALCTPEILFCGYDYSLLFGCVQLWLHDFNLTIKRHFYACEKFMRIYQNGSLDKFMHSKALCIVTYGTILENLCSTNLCDLRLTRIICINLA